MTIMMTRMRKEFTKTMRNMRTNPPTTILERSRTLTARKEHRQLLVLRQLVDLGKVVSLSMWEI